MDLRQYADADMDRMRQEGAAPAPAPVVAPPPPAPAAPPADPMQDPGFRAFVAQRAQAMQELKDAQAKAAETRGSLGYRVGNFLTTLGGGTEGDMAARAARANQPVADVLQRQEAGSKFTDEGAKTAGIQKDVANAALEQAKRDPNSRQSQAVQRLFAPILGDRAKGLSAADVEAASTAGGLDMQKLNAILQNKQLGVSLAAHAETERHNKATEDIDRGRVAFEQSQKGRVPEPEAMKIVNQAQALKAIDELEKLHSDVNGLGMVPVGNTAINRYGDAVNALAGAVAAGALPAARETPALMEEFKKSLPGGMTSHERAKSAFAKLREAVKNNADSQILALKSGNYNPDQIAELQRQAGAGSAPVQQPSVHPQDAEAVVWARANPQDPRAKKILELNGGGQ